MKDLEKCLNDYKKAFEEKILLSNAEVKIKVAQKKAHHDFIRAKEALRAMEIQMAEDSLITQ